MITKEAVKKSSGINLCDILPLKKISKSNSKEKEELISNFNQSKESFKDLEINMKKFFDNKRVYSLLSEIQDEKGIIEKLDKMRKEFLYKYNYLPADMMNSNELKLDTYSYGNSQIFKEKEDLLTKISKTSIISGSDVKAITDKFGFITIPYNCLNEDSFKNESYSKKNEISSFIKNEEYFDIYVITPVEYYSVENHVYKNTEEKEIYAGQHSMIFASVTINIPMFRSILNTVANISDDVNSLKTETSVIKSSLAQMQTTLQNLQRQVEKQQAQMIQQQIQINEQEQSIKSMQRFQEMILRVIDPIMIAVKKGVNINSDEFDEEACFVGPCWGPDFDEKVSMALDLKIIKNQRTSLTKTSAELWN